MAVSSFENLEKMCHNCGILKKGYLKKKMCAACYGYALKNDGRMRPQYLYTDPRYLTCRNKFCKKNLAGQKRSEKGYCYACAEYFRRNNSHRFSKFYNRKRYSPCKICGDTFDVLHKKGGRCRSCHAFLVAYGKDKAPKNYEKYLKMRKYCKNPNCERRLTVWEIQNRAGWCDPCRAYYNRWDEMRPRKLCLNQIPHDKCDCGQEAKHTVDIKILKGDRERIYNGEELEETLYLCDECYELETMDD